MEKDVRPCRIIRSGDIIEVFKYDRLPSGKKEVVEQETLNQWGMEIEEIPLEKWLWVDEWGVVRGPDESIKASLPDGWWDESKRKGRGPGYIKTSNNRSREKIRRLALMNFKDGDTFFTLTFAENVTDLDYANNELKKFFKRLRYKYGAEVPYLGVIEFQERGAIHYHCLVGVELGINWEDEWEVRKTEKEIGEGIWKNGFVDLKNIIGVDNLGAYLVKYLSKDLGDTRLSGKKHYVLSKGLEHPELIKDTTVVLGSLEGHFPTYTSRYDTEFCGKIHYMEYNLRRS